MAAKAAKTSDNEIAIRTLVEEVWNKGNLDATEKFVSPDAIDHDPARPPDLPQGREGLKRVVSLYRAAFPDLTLIVDELFAHEDRVVWRWHSEGTHTGEFLGLLPTNRHGRVTGISIARLEDGKVAETWSEWDNLGLLQQLGVAPAAGSRGEWLGIQAQRISVRAQKATAKIRERAAERRGGGT
jgi:steroid delta-isomerase-like uncharacterized protein